MSEFEDMLGKILSDPGEMEKIADLASQIMGGEAGGGQGKEKSGPDIGKMLGKLMGGQSSGGDKAALVAALGPYLKPERRRKLEKALKISRLAGIAEIAMSGLGEADV